MAGACITLRSPLAVTPGRRPQFAIRNGALLRVRRRNDSLIAFGVGLFYSTSTGNTEEIAGIMKEELGSKLEDGPTEIADVDLGSLTKYDGLIVGSPTWNTGADSQRSGTSWDNLLDDIKALKLNGKKVAVYGLGDQVSYGDYYCDAMEELYSTFKAAGADMVGNWPSTGYEHAFSKAEITKGKFCGLALDEDNQGDQTEARVKKWIGQVVKEMGL